jgi:hypothetical protein
VGRVLKYLLQLRGFCLDVLHSRFLQWTKPLSSSLPLETLADLGRSKSQLIAENALLRQQLIILHRQVKRPVCSKADRTLLVLLARLVHTWEQAHITCSTGHDRIEVFSNRSLDSMDRLVPLSIQGAR